MRQAKARQAECRIAISTIAQLRDADVLITDGGLSEPAREALRAGVGHLIIAS